MIRGRRIVVSQQRMARMLEPRKLLAVFTALGVVLFLLLDHEWNQVLLNLTSTCPFTYGESFGPISYLLPFVLYGMSVLALATSVLALMTRQSRAA